MTKNIYPSDMYPYASDDWLPVAVWEAYEEWLDEPRVSWKLGLGD